MTEEEDESEERRTEGRRKKLTIPFNSIEYRYRGETGYSVRIPALGVS